MRPAQATIGAAGIGYALLAGLENMDFLAEPGPGATAADLAAYYPAGPGLAVAGWLGGLALGAYLIFVAGLAALLPPERRTGPAALLMLGAGIAGPAVAAAALAARAALVGGLDPAMAVGVHAFALGARAIAGVFMGLVLIGAAIAARGPEPVLPRWWTATAPVIGAWLILASGAAFAPTAGTAALALAGFVADAIWIAVAGAYLLMPARSGPRPPTAAVAWLLFLAVAVAAGLSGVLLLALPGHTAGFFSWPLGPPPLAAGIGASYLAAALAYGAGLAGGGPFRRWEAARGLLVGIVVLSVPVLVASVVHIGVFDFGRWQSWAWVVLFGGFPAAAVVLLWHGRSQSMAAHPASGSPDVKGPAASGRGRWRLLPAAGYVATMLAGALLLWERPDLAARLAPLSDFGGRVLGGWLLLAATAVVLAVGRRPLPPIGLLVPGLPAAWLFAGLRLPMAVVDYPAWLLFGAVALVLGLLSLPPPDRLAHLPSTMCLRA